jgi:KDO2-lipid IV(A) lauroyltransferase
MTVGPRSPVLDGLRARLLSLAIAAASRLPERPLDALAGAAGELWYRAAPSRAALGRRNLKRAVTYLAEHGLGGPRIAAAARDDRALERILRATFREAARYYLEIARLPGRGRTDVLERLHIETTDTVDRAFGEDAPAIFVGMHYGAVEYPALFAAVRGGRTIRAPMETLTDPALQAWMRRTRGSVGVEIVPLRDARRALLAALGEGRPIGVVGDRNVAGGTMDVPFFGVPAPLPMAPAFLAVESERPIYVAAVRRLGNGHYAGRLIGIDVPAAGSRRERVTATMHAIAAAMEQLLATAPEQWWGLLAPIWPDLDPRAAVGTGTLEARPAA